MCGIDVHMDPNIGKRLNALGNTLTTLTGEEDIDDIADLNSVNIADLSDEDEVDTMSPTIHTVSELLLGYFGTGFYLRQGYNYFSVIYIIVTVWRKKREWWCPGSAFHNVVL